jgi:murein DD-endopeptidase MepM/ murein hydrolase activator NlpD
MAKLERVRIILAILAVCLIAACTQSPAPVIQYRQREGAQSTGAHTVEKGDTVGNLAERYRLDIRDIMVVNNLQPPYALQPGQRLKLPPPRTYRVRGGDTIYGVSRMFNVSTTQIARLNTLNAPFALSKGQILNLPSVTETPVAIQPQTAVSFMPPPVAAGEGVSIPPPVTSGGIIREELAPPVASGTAIPAPVPQIARPSLEARVPDITPPRSSTRFMRPVEGITLSSYGPKPDGLHNDGMNIKAPKGAPVRAAENGVVVYADNMKGYGNMVLIRHADRWMTAYGHLDNILIERGATVNRGQAIGTVGSSGSVSEPQLHFEVRRGVNALNPEKYM